MPLQERDFINLRTSERFQRFAPTVKSLQRSRDACRLNRVRSAGIHPGPMASVPARLLISVAAAVALSLTN